MDRRGQSSRARGGAAAALLVAALASPGCDDGPADPPSLPRLVLLAVTDPVLDPAAPVPASILWYSTREGRAWVADRTGNPLVEAVHALGGEIVRSRVAIEALSPGDNELEVILAPDSGEPTLRAVALVSVDADCTRPEHCRPGTFCVDYACITD